MEADKKRMELIAKAELNDPNRLAFEISRFLVYRKSFAGHFFSDRVDDSNKDFLMKQFNECETKIKELLML